MGYYFVDSTPALMRSVHLVASSRAAIRRSDKLLNHLSRTLISEHVPRIGSYSPLALLRLPSPAVAPLAAPTDAP